MKLTEKQQRFADYYIETSNATESYIKAGYKEKGARANAARLIANDSISQYIEKRLEELASERIADQQEVLETLTRILRRESKEMDTVIVKKAETIQYSTANGDIAEKIVYNEYAETVLLDTRNSDVNRAAELLGKRYAMWVDNKKIDIKGAVTFIDDVGDEDES
ncbi:terminase small subunit [Peribacillus muralis]|uniref:terminase small subunit n=1 Tax=Peribacillus muralis TaxID=264697 RepID=UPI003CFE0440